MSVNSTWQGSWSEGTTMVNDDSSDDEFIPSQNIHPGILEPQSSASRSLARACDHAHAFRYSQVDDPPGRLTVPHFLAPFPTHPAGCDEHSRAWPVCIFPPA